MKEFKVNQYITLKLEGEKTVIYVKNEPFILCKRLVLHIPVENAKDFDGIDSIDTAADLYEKTIMDGKVYKGLHKTRPINVNIDISSEEEFWGHCSNLQVWVENDYNTNILHSNIAFPLLKKLKEIGDPLAKLRYKDELGERIFKGNINLISFLLSEQFMEDLTTEEIDFFFLKSNKDLRDEIIDEIKKSYEGTGEGLMNNIEQNRGYHLLRRLTELGDKEAKKILKKEIINRLKTGDVWVLCAFINMENINGFLKILSDIELESIITFIRSKLDKETQDIFNRLDRIALKNFEKLTDKSLLDKDELETITEIEEQIGGVDFLASGLSEYSIKRKIIYLFFNVLVVLKPFNK